MSTDNKYLTAVNEWGGKFWDWTRGVRYAKFQLIQYFIDIDILQNLLREALQKKNDKTWEFFPY